MNNAMLVYQAFRKPPHDLYKSSYFLRALSVAVVVLGNLLMALSAALGILISAGVLLLTLLMSAASWVYHGVFSGHSYRSGHGFQWESVQWESVIDNTYRTLLAVSWAVYLLAVVFGGFMHSMGTDITILYFVHWFLMSIFVQDIRDGL